MAQHLAPAITHKSGLHGAGDPITVPCQSSLIIGQRTMLSLTNPLSLYKDSGKEAKLAALSRLWGTQTLGPELFWIGSPCWSAGSFFSTSLLKIHLPTTHNYPLKSEIQIQTFSVAALITVLAWVPESTQ